MADGAPPYNGLSLVADTSAWTSIRKPAAPANCVAEFQAALANGQLCISPVVRLEMVWGARSVAELEQEEDAFQGIRELPITAEIVAGAISGLRSMIGQSPGFQRVPLMDALIAATAQRYAYGVLAYDHDYDRLAPVFGFTFFWVAPCGSI